MRPGRPAGQLVKDWMKHRRTVTSFAAGRPWMPTVEHPEQRILDKSRATEKSTYLVKQANKVDINGNLYTLESLKHAADAWNKEHPQGPNMFVKDDKLCCEGIVQARLGEKK